MQIHATPQQILNAALSGAAPNIWAIGDSINIELNGRVGAQTFQNDTRWDAVIIGFNHNSAYEGNNTVHFQFARNSNHKQIAFVDHFYGHSPTSENEYYCMNLSVPRDSTPGEPVVVTSTNIGGWKDSFMRQTICAQFLHAMPADWQAVITECPKWTDNVGYENYIPESMPENVTETLDKIFLLSCPEILRVEDQFHHNHIAPAPFNGAEINKTALYAYYANNVSTSYGTDFDNCIRYKSSDFERGSNWWLRSPFHSAGSFMIVLTNGSVAGSNDSDYSEGFAPAFKIGGDSTIPSTPYPQYTAAGDYRFGTPIIFPPTYSTSMYLQKSGYKFAGWFLDSTLVTEISDVQHYTMSDNDATIYAKWVNIDECVSISPTAEANLNNQFVCYNCGLACDTNVPKHPVIPEFISNYSSIIDFTGQISADAIGTYTVYATPKVGYCWSDNSSTTRLIPWQIKECYTSINASVVVTNTTYYPNAVFDIVVNTETSDGVPEYITFNNVTQDTSQTSDQPTFSNCAHRRIVSYMIQFSTVEQSQIWSIETVASSCSTTEFEADSTIMIAFEVTLHDVE